MPITTQAQKTIRVVRTVGVCAGAHSDSGPAFVLVRSSNRMASNMRRTINAASHAINRKTSKASTNARIPGKSVAILVNTRSMDSRNDSSTCCHITLLLFYGLKRSGHLHRDNKYGLDRKSV